MKWKCDICKKIFTTSSSVHVQTVHEKLKPYVSTECNKTFGLKNSLTAHMGVHTNDKPFKCSFCEKAFERKDTLSGHTIRMHTKEFPFCCEFCQKGFIKACDLKICVRKKH